MPGADERYSCPQNPVAWGWHKYDGCTPKHPSALERECSWPVTRKQPACARAARHQMVITYSEIRMSESEAGAGSQAAMRRRTNDGTEFLISALPWESRLIHASRVCFPFAKRIGFVAGSRRGTQNIGTQTTEAHFQNSVLRRAHGCKHPACRADKVQTWQWGLHSCKTKKSEDRCAKTR
jgi:hypothetical protein